MGDSRKTKQELVAEVQELRRRLQEAEEALKNLGESGPAGEGSIQAERLSGGEDICQDAAGLKETEPQRQHWLAQLEVQAEEMQVANEELTVQAEELRIQYEELQAITLRLEVQNEALERISGELEAERALLRTVLEQMPAGVIIVAAPSGKFLLVNRQMQKILGHPVSLEASLETCPPYEAIHPDGRPLKLREHPLAQAIAVGRAVSEEPIDVIREDGARRTLQVSAAPVRDRLGRIIAGVGTYQDITEQKQAEAEIQRLASFPHLNPSPVLEIDGLGRITYYNQATVKVLDKIGGQAELNDFLPKDLEEIQAAARQKRVRNFYREVRIEDVVFVENIYFAAPFDVLRIYASDITERKRAEAALRESDKRTIDILESITDGFFSCDQEMVVTYFNSAAAKILGRDRSEVLGRKLFDAFPEARGSVFEEKYTEALRQGKFISFEAYFQPEPYRNWYDVRVFPYEEGISVYFQVTTERRLAVEALRRAKEEWEFTFNAVPDFIAIIDKEHRIVRVNRAMAEALGAEPEDLVDRACHEIMHNRSGPPPFCPHSQLLADGREHAAEVHELNRDFLVSASPLTDGQGNLVGSVHVARDITERKRAEEELRRAHDKLEERVRERTADLNRTVEQLQFEIEERSAVEEKLRENEDIFRGTFDQSPVGAVMAGLDFRFKRVNAAFCNLTGYSEEELKSLTFPDITHPDDLAADLAEARRLAAGEIGRHDLEKRFVRKDGSPVWVHLTSRVMKDAAGRPLYFLAIIQDINARKQAEQTAEIDRQRLFAVLERMPAYVALLKPDYTIPFANREFVRRFGDPGNELCYEFLFGLKEPCENCKSHEVFQTKTPVIWEWAGPDGNTYQIYDYPFTDMDGSPLALEMGVDITTRKQAEDKLRRQTAMLAGINRVFREALTCKTEEELGVTCLAVAEELTGSPFGFIGEENQPGRLDILAFSDPGWEACRMGKNGKERLKLFSLKVQGLKGGVVREGRSVIANNLSNHPEAASLPPGHPPLTSYLGVALKHGGKTFGLLGLANKEGGYTRADQEVIETLAVAIVEALMRFRAENKATRFSRLYRLLSQVNETIVRAPDQATLFQQVCRIAVEEGLFKMAWIGVVDQESGLVKAVAQHGLEEGYLGKIKIPLVDVPESRGPTGTSVREGRYDICNDFANDPRMSPWREEALKRGYRSSGAFPLRVGSRVIGALTLYAGEPGFFTDEEIGLLESLAHDVSFAMESMEREAQRRRAEAALKESEGRLRYLAAQLIDAQEAERKRVALELHDDLGQSLMVLTMQLRAIARLVPPDRGEILDHCNLSLNYVYEIIENVRRLARDLRPSLLEDLGLPAALRHLVETFHTYHGIEVSLDMDDIAGLFAPHDEINIYRVFQESLTNIAKYAQATQVSFTIRKLAGWVSFRVDDNGRGFDREEILVREASKRGLGLAAMEERGRMLGGSLEIWSQEGQGSSITFMVPVRT